MSRHPRTRGFQHDALFFSDDQTLASAAVPFIREGLDRDEIVFIGCGGHPVMPLLTALFGDEPRVRFEEKARRRSRPVAVVDKYQREMDAGLRRGVPGFRATGFTDLDQGQDEWRQWLRYEAAVNRIFADYPFRALCLWDSRRLPAERAKAYRAAHPGLVGPSGLRPNGEYVAPEELVSRPEHRPRPDPAQAGPPQYDADVGDDLRHLRLDLYPVALSSQMRSDALDDFIKAVGGVVLNACAHGSGNVRVRLWAPPHKLVCTVTDRGPGIDDPFVGYGKPAVKSPREAPGNGGLGMWAARQLCDRLDYGSGPDGFTVRLVSRD